MGKEDDGPAFPVLNYELGKDFGGMSLRDWFAGQAVNALIINDAMAKLKTRDVRAIRESKESSKDTASKFGITSAYVNMLKARKSWSHV